MSTTGKPGAADSESRFSVLEGFRETAFWLDDVCQASDLHRNELGFFARKVFEQFARRDRLYVLVERLGSVTKYAGHLLFDLRFPRASVRQMVTSQEFRRQGAASTLLEHLRRSLTGQFISIYARVAEDMVPANRFWERQGFYVQRIVPGGVSRNRTILVRSFELDSPQLFPASGMNDQNPLGLVAPAANDMPTFLLDMNVLFDLNPRRFRREKAVSLVQAERLNLCRLAISDEIQIELRRTVLAERNTDPMGALVDTFPCVPVGTTDDVDELATKLATLVFPDSSTQNLLTASQKSDLRHIVATIRNDLAGLVTNDQALLDCAAEIEKIFGIQVLSSASLFPSEVPHEHNDDFECNEREPLRLRSVTSEHEVDVRNFLSNRAHLSGSEIVSQWLSIGNQSRISNRYAVWAGEICIGYLTWPSWTRKEAIIARAVVDESHQQALLAARVLLVHLIELLSPDSPRKVTLELPKHQANLREVASGLGFVGTMQDHQLIKSILGRVLTPYNWASQSRALTSADGPRLPEHAPTFHDVQQQVAVFTPDGNRRFVSLDRIETLLAPTLLLLPGRPAVITPIRRKYAELLLGHSPQESFLPRATASTFSARVYVSDPKTLRHFRRGTLIFFYESKKDRGHCHLIAVARTREAYLKPCDAVDLLDLQRSVVAKRLSEIGKSPMKTITVFDNVFPLPRPVDLRVLQRLGCGAPHQLITTQAINEQQVREIIAEGFGYD